MPESTSEDSTVNLDEEMTVSKLWLDSLLDSLQRRIGQMEVQNSSLLINIEIEKARNNELREQIDELSAKVATNGNENGKDLELVKGG